MRSPECLEGVVIPVRIGAESRFGWPLVESVRFVPYRFELLRATRPPAPDASGRPRCQ